MGLKNLIYKKMNIYKLYIYLFIKHKNLNHKCAGIYFTHSHFPVDDSNCHPSLVSHFSLQKNVQQDFLKICLYKR